MEAQAQTYPKTLIISANALSTQTNNGKMVASFFKSYPTENLAQIFTWPEYPDSAVCENYYRITDQEMLRSWLGTVPGKQVERRPAQQDGQMPGIFRKSFKNWPVMRLIRDVVWTNPRWKTADLVRWLDDFSPEIVFFLGLNNPAMYRMAEWVSERYRAPVIVYITDDYFLPRRSFSPCFHIRRQWLETSMRRLLHREHTALLTINRYMAEAYRDFFGKEGVEIFNAVPVPENVSVKEAEDGPVYVSYIGNLLNDRTSTLQAFCRLLDGYPRKDAFRFQIFTRETFSQKQLKRLTLPPWVEHCGALDAEGVSRQLQRSDVLMHMESFHYQNRRDTLLSLSTKLMEYLAAARPVLMIGPPEVGSSRFLKEETTNIVVDSLSSESVYAALDRLLDAGMRKRISEENIENARRLQRKNNNDHLVQTVSAELLAETAE